MKIIVVLIGLFLASCASTKTYTLDEVLEQSYEQGKSGKEFDPFSLPGYRQLRRIYQPDTELERTGLRSRD